MDLEGGMRSGKRKCPGFDRPARLGCVRKTDPVMMLLTENNCLGGRFSFWRARTLTESSIDK